MKNSSTYARSAALNSTEHRFPWKWQLSDLTAVEKNGKTVFSCFSCGGGSTMGYKLAGYEVIGNCEIDPRMMAIYRKNHNPKYSYLMDIRDFVKQSDLPAELRQLDILDGSPPCSVFSIAGKREAGWNKEKTFREGQKKQRLDDLFFHFIEVARLLQPKVIVAENVVGIIMGNAKGYVNEILKAYDAAGYKTQIFRLNAATMGVPQKRERIFFISQRKDLNFPKLKLEFSEKPILFGEVRSEKGGGDSGRLYTALIKQRIALDFNLADISERVSGKRNYFTNPINHDSRVSFTITSGGETFRYCDGEVMSQSDFINTQTFPQDYDFGKETAKYVCGMSVPPVMMANIATEIYSQWLNGR